MCSSTFDIKKKGVYYIGVDAACKLYAEDLETGEVTYFDSIKKSTPGGLLVFECNGKEFFFDISCIANAGNDFAAFLLELKEKLSNCSSGEGTNGGSGGSSEDPQIETHSYTLLCDESTGEKNFYLAYGVYEETEGIEAINLIPVGDSPPLDSIENLEICGTTDEDEDAASCIFCYDKSSGNTSGVNMFNSPKDSIHVSNIGVEWVRLGLITPTGTSFILLAPGETMTLHSENNYLGYEAEIVSAPASGNSKPEDLDLKKTISKKGLVKINFVNN